MRIVGGIYRGRKLKSVAGFDVRPTSDRLRETLFNILAPHLRDSRFLDLCAGSGAIAIEALSRGASEAVLIDHSRVACKVIQDNLRTLGIRDEARLINRDVTVAIKQLEAERKAFDLIFFDPPYASPIYSQVMAQLATSPILHSETIIIVEHRTRTPIEGEYGNLKMYREVKQGESALAFYAATSSQ